MLKITLLTIFSLVVRMDAAQFSTKVFKSYSAFKVNQIVDKRFDVDNYFKCIDSLIRFNPNRISKEEIGRSFKNKKIFLFKIGQGKKRVLLWSQMHGDESTASLALLDVFNFFIQDKVEYKSEIQKILSECTLYFIPILNPDGTKKFERRNAQEIDINRDALALQTPEAKLLKLIRDKIKPDFAFNLHDQTALNSVGR
ncbi:MAG: M14 family zinc carboxypeptidase, partial [Ignavibacteria bacterium]|nr:M14 family zinc carboxypeptidase [Ignavibacteria bacterium]